MLTAEQCAIQELAREVAEAEIASRAADWDRAGAFDPAVLKTLAELGFLGMFTPEAYGGLGLDLPTYLVAFEELARADAALSLTLHIQNGPIPYLLLSHGAEAQRAKWLPALAAGDAIAGFALSEEDAGSDPASMTTVARETVDGWAISGRKKWVTNGGRADVVVVFARTDAPGSGKPGKPGSGRNRIGAFLVDTAAPGYQVGKRERTMGLRASETVAVTLDDVRVARDRLVGDPARGLAYALQALDLGRLGIATQAVGIAQAALDHAVAYARERRQFDRPIAEFGAIRSKLAAMATRIAASRALTMDGAQAWEARHDLQAGAPSMTARSSMAKLMASETAGWVTEEAVRIFGGYGFMREYPVEKLMRDAKATEIYEGTSEIQRLVIGRSLTRC